MSVSSGSFQVKTAGGNGLRNPSGKHTTALPEAVPVLKKLARDANINRVKLAQVRPFSRKQKRVGVTRFLKWISGGFIAAITCSAGDQLVCIYSDTPELVLGEHAIEFDPERVFSPYG